MAELPGQPEAITDDDNRTTTHWYLFFRELWTALAGTWKAYTPVVTASSGTIAAYTATGRYRRVGKTVDLQINVTVSNIGSGSGNVTVSLPPGQKTTAFFVLTGRENAINGAAVVGLIGQSTSQAGFIYYNASQTLANGVSIAATGTYEIQ